MVSAPLQTSGRKLGKKSTKNLSVYIALEFWKPSQENFTSLANCLVVHSAKPTHNLTKGVPPCSLSNHVACSQKPCKYFFLSQRTPGTICASVLVAHPASLQLGNNPRVEALQGWVDLRLLWSSLGLVYPLYLSSLYNPFTRFLLSLRTSSHTVTIIGGPMSVPLWRLSGWCQP